ncbi:MAG TPA: PHP domain-containing protein [Nitrospiraceae bacterium]|nr:PHP domain-containing protein [Nitrospiraceae bacterium]
MRDAGRLMLAFMVAVLCLCWTLGHAQGSDGRQPLLATVHVHSTASTGELTIEALAERAEQLGLDALILTDNFALRYEYGLWPLPGLLKRQVRFPSVLEYGIERYLDEIAAAQRRHPKLIILPGIEVAPYYYWTGSLWGRTLTMHNAQRNLLVLGLTRPEDYRSLPVSGNPGSYTFDWRVVVNGAPMLLAVPAVWLWRPLRRMSDRRSLQRTAACFLIILAVALVANAWPLSQPAFSSYDDQLQYRPYQALIDDVRAKGGLVFWSMTEARDFREYAAGPLGTVTVKTEPHPEALLQTTGYTGFGGLYQDGRTIIKPGELWDRLLQVPAHERRPIPMLIGELAFHGLRDAGKDLHRLVMGVRVKERTVAGVLEALQSGHSYAVGEGDHHVQLRLDDFRIVCQGGTRSASVGDSLDPGGASDLMVRLSVTASDRGHHPVKVRVIRSGQVLAQLAGETPFRVDWPDTTLPMEERLIYRVEITGSGELLSNPIVVGPILESKAIGFPLGKNFNSVADA